ncbi:DUF6318 family protein [Terrabacter sp. 2RAF25]|uniref:DUF6318 family protein n=1 Tax=Terrabacter sp. 2RAF25 TaxID=3232998 RepID=UPI003F94AA15
MTAAARAHRHRRLIPYAAALVALAMLGACTGSEPAPTSTTPPRTSAAATTTSSAPSTTTTPTPTATVDPVLAKIPAAARPSTDAGAAAFSKYYFERVNSGFRTGSTSDVHGLAQPDCVTCNAFASAIKEQNAKGTHYGADLARIDFSSPLEVKLPNARVLVDLSQLAVPILNSNNKKVGTTPTGNASFVVSLKYEGHWIVTRLQKTEN